MEETKNSMSEKSLEELQQEIEAINNIATDNTLQNEGEQNLPSKTPTKNEKYAMSTFKNKTLDKIQEDFLSGKVDADEGTKQLVNVMSIINATEDDKLRKSLQKKAARSMEAYMEGIKYKDESLKIEHRQRRNEVFYKAFRPILEFDLSHLIGKKRKRIVERDPQTRKKTVRYEDIPEEAKKTYEDRSYGLTLMLIMIALFCIPYCVANILLAVGRLINSLFECFNQFGRTAFWLCTSIAGITIVGLFLYVLLLILQAAFGVKIFTY